MKNFVSSADKLILRDVAKRQLELASSERNKALIKQWYGNNDCQIKNPTVHIELGTFGAEVVPARLKCEGDYARSVESSLYYNFTTFELFGDDYVVPDFFPISYHVGMNLLGQDIPRESATDTEGRHVGYQYKHIMSDLHDDFNMIKKSTWSVDREGTKQQFDDMNELFGDIIPAKMTMGSLGLSPTQKIIHLMGMENMFYSMNDYPDEFKKMMDMIATDTVEYFDWLAKEKLILPTAGRSGLAQGSMCFTNDLPNEEVFKTRSFTSKDVWGYVDSQETVSVSPEMFEEFIFPAYKKITDQYGLLSYGCCEPIDPFWDKCISKMENLRKVSISPWCNEEYMGEQLRYKKIIFHRKPFPNYIGVGKVMDEAATREHIAKTCIAARGCNLEFSQRDVYSVNYDIPKVKRYVEIIREEIDKNWRS